MGQDDPAILERLPDTGDGDKSSPPVVLSRGFITRYSPDHYVIPHVKSTLDLRIVEKIVSTTPPLGDPAWSIRFSRELNATEDRSCLFGTGPGLPILEGKHLAPFAVDVAAARWFIREDDASQLVAPARTFHRARLGYRDVASATNALTLIAAIVPRAVLTTHSVFCLSSDAGEELQCYLCGMLNSYVANYLVRLRVSTHVTAASMSQLQVPRPGIDSRPFATVCRLTGRLNESRGADEDAHAVLQAWAARLYGLDPEEFSHVLETFPLVEQTRRAAALRAFELMEDSKT
jgi:hypothetical protein